MDHSSFYFEIQRHYGANMRQHFRQIQIHSNRLASTKAREVFLLKCRRFELVPRFILDKTNPFFNRLTDKPNATLNNLRTQLNKALLNHEIGQCITLKRNVEFELTHLKSIINGCQPHAQTHIDNINNLFAVDLRNKNLRLFSKFSHLLHCQQHLPDIIFEENFIENLTTTNIPYEMSLLLSLGPKFAMKPDELPIPDLVCDLEFLISKFAHPNIANAIRSQLVYALTKHSTMNQPLNRIQRFLQKAAKTTADFLKQNPNIFVSYADKGNKTVVCDRDDYKTKLKSLLDDNTNFEPLLDDPTKACTKKICDRLDALQRKGTIDKYKKLSLKPPAPIPPRVYGLYKLHKPDRPLRLITSTIQSPSYNVAKELSIVLTKAFDDSKYSIKNTQGILHTIRNHRCMRNHRMVSFDMVNCFGSIPTELAIGYVRKNFHKVQPHTNWSVDDFVDMLTCCLNDCNYLLFDDNYYRQKNGIFMGNSLGSILVQIVTDEIVEGIKLELAKRRISFPAIWKVYVDDHFIVCHKDSIDILLECLNGFNENIKFTKEDEENGVLNYLDLTIHRQDSTIVTNWYTKPMASNRLLNFHSAHPKNMVYNVAKSFVQRVHDFSDQRFHHGNMTKISAILSKNSFPKETISKLLHSVYTNPVARQPRNVSNQFCSIAYIPDVTESLSRRIKYFLPDLQIANRPDLKNSRFFSKQKCKLPLDTTSNCVYQIDCSNCNSVYIGETKRAVGTRMREHQNSIRPQNVSKHTTALAQHASEMSHQFNFDQVKVLDRKNNVNKLKTAEVAHIIINKNACNFKSDSRTMAASYGNLLNKTTQSIHTDTHTHTPP